jgi:hypothetical protein
MLYQTTAVQGNGWVGTEGKCHKQDLVFLGWARLDSKLFHPFVSDIWSTALGTSSWNSWISVPLLKSLPQPPLPQMPQAAPRGPVFLLSWGVIHSFFEGWERRITQPPQRPVISPVSLKLGHSSACHLIPTSHFWFYFLYSKWQEDICTNACISISIALL